MGWVDWKELGGFAVALVFNEVLQEVAHAFLLTRQNNISDYLTLNISILAKIGLIIVLIDM